MKKRIINLIFTLSIPLLFTACGIGSLVAVPFKVTGAVVNIVTPDIVGDTISGTGEAVDAAIPF